MRVLIAFDKFKDSLTAAEACQIAARVISQSHPSYEIEMAPLSDGGDGFCQVLTESLNGSSIEVQSSGPCMEKLHAPIGMVETIQIPSEALAHLDLSPTVQKIALIEMATTSGLSLLPPERRNPWETTSYGTGQLIRIAIERGAQAIILGVGGSATNDLGLGALSALGFDFLQNDGSKAHPPFPSRWKEIEKIEGQTPQSMPPLFIACDVSNPLFGPNGAASIYGPQKGLSVQDIPQMERLSHKMAALLCHLCQQSIQIAETPGAGAAGGIAFGLLVAAKVRLISGIDLVSSWLQLNEKMAAAELVITGEGRFDESSLAGKGPGTLVKQSLGLGKKTVIFAGSIDKSLAMSCPIHEITPEGQLLPEALSKAGTNLAASISKHFQAQ
ncbi:MAG: glycerate kinase [Opitutaceae bacterium]|nr:glycerate kinase [Opitutaceae bacterium]